MDRTGTALRSLIDARDLQAVGRTARLDLRFERRRGRTVLAACYAEPPLRVGPSFEDGDGLHLILASSAPGVFGGDRIEQHVAVGQGARVRLTSQSALQAHPSSSGEPVRLAARYDVDEGGELRCQWDPLIPFAGVSVHQRVALQLSGDARVYWSDALMAGREARGERWMFAGIDHELRVARHAHLEYLERYVISPEEGGLARPWVAGDACYFGTTIASGWEPSRDGVERLHATLQDIEGVRAAADLVDSRLAVVRIVGARGAPFHKARRYAAAVSSA